MLLASKSLTSWSFQFLLPARGAALCLAGVCISVGTFIFPTPSAAQEVNPEFREVLGDRFCPDGQRLMSYSFAIKNKTKICDSLQNWAVARLAGGGSFAGHGNNCELYKVDHRPLGSSLCVPLQNFSAIRGVLLQGRFRTQSELNTMSELDWRSALTIELANRTAGTRADYESLDNVSLAGAGALFVHLQNTNHFSAQQFAGYNLEMLRQTVIYELNKQTGIPVTELSRQTDLELVELFWTG